MQPKWSDSDLPMGGECFLARLHDVDVYRGMFRGVDAVCVVHAWGYDIVTIAALLDPTVELWCHERDEGQTIDRDPLVTWHDIRRLLHSN